MSNLKNQLIGWTSSGEVGIKPAYRRMNIHTIRSTLDPLLRRLRRRSGIVYQLTLLGVPGPVKPVIKHLKYRKVPVIYIRVETHLPHNGCRLPKRGRK